MKATVKIDAKANTVTVVLPLSPALSKSGTMLLLGCTRGNQETEATYEHDGEVKQVYANVNIGVYATPKPVKAE